MEFTIYDRDGPFVSVYCTNDATTSTGEVRDPTGGVETHHRVRVSFAEGRRNCGLSHLFVGSATGGKANVMGMVTGMVSVMGM